VGEVAEAIKQGEPTDSSRIDGPEGNKNQQSRCHVGSVHLSIDWSWATVLFCAGLPDHRCAEGAVGISALLTVSPLDAKWYVSAPDIGGGLQKKCCPLANTSGTLYIRCIDERGLTLR
jgi:hypothetical protein